MLTVNQLVENYDLGLSLLAGHAGGDRKLAWAHSVELPDPWLCALSGTLLMTTGVGIPKAAAAQVTWIKNLIESDAKALLFAPRDPAFKLSDKMLQVASDASFPIISASFELEFVAVAQVVIEKALTVKQDPMNSSSQIFQIYADTLWEATALHDRLRVLGEKLSVRLQIINSETLQVMFSSNTNGMKAESPVRVPIPGRSKAALIVSNNYSKVFDSLILSQILAGLLSVELERVIVERDILRKDGEELFQDFFNGEIEYSAAKVMLERRGLFGRLVTISISLTEKTESKYASLHHIPLFHRLSPLFFKDEKKMLMVIPDDMHLLEMLINHLGENTKIGISSPISVATGFKESISQANLMLVRLHESHSQVGYYRYLDTEFALGPKTLAEARSLVDYYFGALIEHERSKSLPLLQTLAVFLKHNSNWKATSAELDIHRQTLVYRLKLIEELTGIKPTTSIGIAKFWVALEAIKVLGGIEYL